MSWLRADCSVSLRLSFRLPVAGGRRAVLEVKPSDEIKRMVRWVKENPQAQQ